MVNSLKDKGALVTGAGRGIGKRLALGFAEAGARVGLLARGKAELDLAQLEIEHAGGVALRIRADVTDYEQMCAAADRMRAHFGGVHVLVAAAAVQGPVGPLAEVSPAAWAEAIQVNLIGVMHSCRAVLPQMIERRSGKIIVLSGEGAGGPRPNFSAYAAAKAGLVRLVETLAEEVRDHNIQVNAMTPGGAYTHMTDEDFVSLDCHYVTGDPTLVATYEDLATPLGSIASGSLPVSGGGSSWTQILLDIGVLKANIGNVLQVLTGTHTEEAGSGAGNLLNCYDAQQISSYIKIYT